jgi:hypothetical protein
MKGRHNSRDSWTSCDVITLGKYLIPLSRLRRNCHLKGLILGSFSDDSGSGLAGILMAHFLSCSYPFIVAYEGVLTRKFPDQRAITSFSSTPWVGTLRHFFIGIGVF